MAANPEYMNKATVDFTLDGEQVTAMEGETLIIGTTGTGKSTLARALAVRLTKKGCCVAYIIPGPEVRPLNVPRLTLIGLMPRTRRIDISSHDIAIVDVPDNWAEMELPPAVVRVTDFVITRLTGPIIAFKTLTGAMPWMPQPLLSTLATLSRGEFLLLRDLGNGSQTLNKVRTYNSELTCYKFQLHLVGRTVRITQKRLSDTGKDVQDGIDALITHLFPELRCGRSTATD